MKAILVDENKQPIHAPYLVRLGGWTLERYLQEAPEHPFLEYVRGEVVMYSPATAEHQRIVGFLFRLLGGFLERRRWGEVLAGPAALEILPEVIREPDLFVLPPEAIPQAQGTPLKVRPVWVIEVLSPNTRSVDLGEKPQEYAQAGIPEYWVVDPEGKEVHRFLLKGSKYQETIISSGKLESTSVPSFWLEVDWLFQKPLPPVLECLQKIG